jgi:hypothetical protein
MEKPLVLKIEDSILYQLLSQLGKLTLRHDEGLPFYTLEFLTREIQGTSGNTPAQALSLLSTKLWTSKEAEGSSWRVIFMRYVEGFRRGQTLEQRETIQDNLEMSPELQCKALYWELAYCFRIKDVCGKETYFIDGETESIRVVHYLFKGQGILGKKGPFMYALQSILDIIYERPELRERWKSYLERSRMTRGEYVRKKRLAAGLRLCDVARALVITDASLEAFEYGIASEIINQFLTFDLVASVIPDMQLEEWQQLE